MIGTPPRAARTLGGVALLFALNACITPRLFVTADTVQMGPIEGALIGLAGRRIPAWGDKLGQMVVEPRCAGRCTVELKYDAGTEGRSARAIHRAALGGGAVWILVAILWRKRSGSTKTN